MTPARLTPACLVAALIAALFLAGCAEISPSKGGGQTAAPPARQANAADIAVPAGYRIELVASGLNLPTGVAFDDQDNVYVVEGGYSYGELFTEPRLIALGAPQRETQGVLTNTSIAKDVHATGDRDHAPWTGAAFANGAMFVAEGGELAGGRISGVERGGKLTPLVENLPSLGDHHTNGPVLGPDGFLYFGVGTATNSGIVGPDNFQYGWAKRHPEFHDLPPRDVTLTGENVTSDDPRSPNKSDKVTTGAYVPFGTPTQRGQVIKGQMPCNGAIYRVPIAGGAPQLVAWGLRNPFGLAFGPDGRLLVTENAYDDRGSRPVWGAADVLWAINPKQPPLWYGWPDFAGGEPLTWADHFQPTGKPAPKFLLAQHPNDPPQPIARLPVHGCACGLDVSRNQTFGHAGEAFIALFGDLAPEVGKTLEPVGFQIVRVNLSTGVIEPFAANRGKTNGPASKLKSKGFERPIACRFDRTGNALYVVDFGVMTVDKSGAHPRPNTGALWRITRAEEQR